MAMASGHTALCFVSTQFWFSFLTQLLLLLLLLLVILSISFHRNSLVHIFALFRIYLLCTFCVLLVVFFSLSMHNRINNKESMGRPIEFINDN